MRPARLAGLLAVLSAIVGWTLALAFPDLVIAGDVTAYFDRVTAIEAGGIPYLDPVFEHLPVMLVPLFVARLMSGFGSEFAFAVAFSALMIVVLSMTAGAMGRLGRDGAGDGLGVRWLWLSLPVFPLVVFRNDPVVVLLAVVSLLPSLRPSLRSAAGIGAVLAKGWPVALVPGLYLAGRRRFAGWLTVAGGLAILVMLSPGFRATQEAAGLHSETLGGSLFGLSRSLQGVDLQIEWTTAVYLRSPPVGYVIGPAVGAAIVLVALRVVRRPMSVHRELLLAGALTTAILLSFRLFSTQYVLWVTPFAAASRLRWIRLSTGVAVSVSVLMLLTWESLFEPNPWWWLLVVARNLLLVAVGFGLAAEAGCAEISPERTLRSTEVPPIADR